MFELKHEEVPVQDEEALIYYVLDLAVTAEKLDIKNSAVLLELTRSAHGLVFMLTVRKKRKHYKILRKNSTAIFGFERLDDFLSCIFAMYRANMNYPESSTYLMSDRYYLCVKGVGTGAEVLMSQYGAQVGNARMFLSRLAEHGNRLTAQNSIALIAESFER